MEREELLAIATFGIAMTTDGDALLQTIIDNPADDLPRLVYADWLEENGQAERAEFTRLKIALEAESGDKRVQMEERARQLLRQHRKEWLTPLPQEPGIEWDANWPRGFPERLTFDGAEPFERLAAEAFAAAPIRRLSIGGLSTQSAVAVVFSPLMNRLIEIDFLYSSIGNMGVQFLLASERFLQLRQLNLTSNGLSDHAILALAEKNALPALEVLVLSHNHISDSGARALAGSQGFRKLDRVYVNDNPLSAVGLRILQDRFRRVISSTENS